MAVVVVFKTKLEASRHAREFNQMRASASAPVARVVHRGNEWVVETFKPGA